MGLCSFRLYFPLVSRWMISFIQSDMVKLKEDYLLSTSPKLTSLMSQPLVVYEKNDFNFNLSTWYFYCPTSSLYILMAFFLFCKK